jgi:anti-sigma factor RsiW
MSALNEQDRADLVAYLDGELDEEAAQALEAKLNLDPQARAEADALRQAWGLLDYLPKAEPSPTFTHRTLEKLSLVKKAGSTQIAAPSWRRWPWQAALGWAAALLIAVLAGLGLGRYLGRSAPEDVATADEPMIQHLRVAEMWRYYENAEDLDFVRQLAQPDLFGDDSGS